MSASGCILFLIKPHQTRKVIWDMPAPLHVFFCLKFEQIILKDFEGASASHYEFCAMLKKLNFIFVLEVHVWYIIPFGKERRFYVSTNPNSFAYGYVPVEALDFPWRYFRTRNMILSARYGAHQFPV